MAISSISTGMNGTQWGAYTQKLTEPTKAKLKELGIPFNDNMTEVQGRNLINQANVKKAGQNNTNDQNQEAQKNNLFEQAKKLAQKLGLTVSEEETFEEIISKIEATLEEKIKNNSNNAQMLNQLKAYSRELAIIQAQTTGSIGTDATNQALMMSLEMLGQYNKSFLNN